MKRVLRVLIDGPRDPWLNMAIDEAIMSLRPRQDSDTLRIYMWLPSGVSIGRRQDVRKAVNLEEVEKLNYKLVRRPTGGAALLHAQDAEITYSVVLSETHEIYQQDVAKSSATIAEGVARTLERLGLSARVGGFKGLESGELCYLRGGSSDVLVGGKKISGSAQRREEGALLQHGTLLLDFDPDLWLRLIRVPGTSRSTLLSSVTSLKQLLGEINVERVVDAMVKGFTEALNAEETVLAGLTVEEVSLALHLYRSKYSTPPWNLRGERGRRK